MPKKKQTPAQQRMAHARSKIKKPVKRAGPVDVLKRVNRAFELIPFHRRYVVREKIMNQFKCCADSAETAIRKAKERLAVIANESRQDHLALALEQIEDTIRVADHSNRLAAIKLKMELLGLGAPKQTEVAVAVTSYDPAALAAMRDPQLREKALQLEEEISEFHERED